MVNQAKLHSFHIAPKYKYGYEITRDYGNTHWQDATALELAQLHEYKTFKDLG
jgi:hypothetical protein